MYIDPGAYAENALKKHPCKRERERERVRVRERDIYNYLEKKLPSNTIVPVSTGT